MPEQVVVTERVHALDGATARRVGRAPIVCGMRLAEFWEQMNRQFGPAYAESVARDHVCSQLDGRTAAQAVEDGEPIRNVWLAICADFELPPRVR